MTIIKHTYEDDKAFKRRVVRHIAEQIPELVYEIETNRSSDDRVAQIRSWLDHLL